VALALVLGACASITRGMTNQVQLMSNPPEAQARTSMGHVCVTPCTLQFNRKDEFTVLFSKPGYHSAEVPVKTQVAGAGAAGFAGNILVGGVVGMGVDAVSGATLEHFPNPVAATLVPLKRGEPARIIKIVPEPPAPKPEEIQTTQTSSLQ
jgi:hypothetical protein